MTWSMNVKKSKIRYQPNHKKIIFSWIKNFPYLAVHNNGGMNWQNNETYDLQWSNCKIMMTITIINERMRIRCSVNMYKLKQLYQYKRNNLTYQFYYDYYFNKNSLTSK